MKHLGTKRLETDRLLLRPFVMEDAPGCFSAWMGNVEVTEYLTWPAHNTLEETEEVLAYWIRGYENPASYHWLIVLKDTNEPVGNISVVHHDDAIDEVHIGYVLSPDFWGQGIMAEALSRLITFFFDEVGARRIESMHAVGNEKSGRVMEKAGMVKEALLRDGDLSNKGRRDAVVYAIIHPDVDD